METQATTLHERNEQRGEWFDRPQTPTSTSDDSFERRAAFDGLKLRVSSRQFRSGRVTAVVSGVTLDLRDAVLSPEGATIVVESALSGIDILVPPDWDVVCDVDGVFAGIDGDRAAVGAALNAPQLRVTGTVVAGGLCVR